MLLGQTPLPSFPSICGKVSLSSEVQAETSGLGQVGEEGWAAWAPSLGHHPGPSVALSKDAALWFALQLYLAMGITG